MTECNSVALRDLYISLLRDSLLGLTLMDPPFWAWEKGKAGFGLPFDRDVREAGRDWPSLALTMIGLKRMNNILYCIEKIVEDKIPGDLIETGVWRGGATIFMKGILKAYGETRRNVWVADSFEGVPPPNIEKYPSDGRPVGRALHQADYLSASEDEVMENFRRFNLLDEQVRFLKGWFRDTLPTAPIEQLSLLRLDGDLYESTMDALTSLYPKLAKGGFVIVDDYNLPTCVDAVTDYRRTQKINDEILNIDGCGVFWRPS